VNLRTNLSVAVVVVVEIIPDVADRWWLYVTAFAVLSHCTAFVVPSDVSWMTEE